MYNLRIIKPSKINQIDKDDQYYNSFSSTNRLSPSQCVIVNISLYFSAIIVIECFTSVILSNIAHIHFTKFCFIFVLNCHVFRVIKQLSIKSFIRAYYNYSKSIYILVVVIPLLDSIDLSMFSVCS